MLKLIKIYFYTILKFYFVIIFESYFCIMISVNNIYLYFGGQNIFNDVSFMVNRNDKIGLVGKNGAGKSTLLKVLSNEQTLNNGNISSPNEIKLGYLKQDLDFVDGKTVLEDAFNQL